MFRALLYVLLILLLIRAVVRFLRGVSQGASGGAASASRPASPSAVKMVRDPVCGTYVVPGRAIELTRGHETMYFCSENCREKYAIQG